MKKATIILVILLAIINIAAPATGIADQWVTGSEDGVNVRDPETHELVGLVTPGTLVDVLYQDDYWLHISYGDQEAIVYKEYFTPLDGEYTPTTTPTTPSRPKKPLLDTMVYTGVVTKNTKVWVDPDKGPEKAGTLEEGTEILIRAIDKYWYRIYFDGHLRYIPRESAQVTGINLPGDGKVYRLQIPESWDSTVVPIREQPTKESSQLAKLAAGDFVRVVDSLGGWSLVIYDTHGSMGFVSSWYLKEYHGVGSSN